MKALVKSSREPGLWLEDVETDVIVSRRKITQRRRHRVTGRQDGVDLRERAGRLGLRLVVREFQAADRTLRDRVGGRLHQEQAAGHERSVDVEMRRVLRNADDAAVHEPEVREKVVQLGMPVIAAAACFHVVRPPVN